MKISIQIRLDEPTWDDCVPVLHEVENWKEAVAIAYAISRQTFFKTVRLVQVPTEMSLVNPDRRMIGNISGTYIQAKVYHEFEV